MRILFTGMASSHTNADVHKNKLGFFGALSKVIVDGIGHTIEWREPSVLWTKKDLEKYDQIFVGIVPPTSLGANKVYGALHLISLLEKDPRLILILDNPQLWQFKTSFAAVARDPKTLVSIFYSKRSEYQLVHKNDALLYNFSDISGRMASGIWPKTIYPSLPWKDNAEVKAFLGLADSSSLLPINVDSHLIQEGNVSYMDRSQLWLIDNPTTSWSKSISNMVHQVIDSMKTSKKDTDYDIYTKLKSALGSMISPQERGVGTWWTYRYVQSLNAGTPIVTDWREAIQMSDSWGFLAYQIEEMNESRRKDLAKHQKESYLDAIPTKIEAILQVERLLLNTGREVQNA